MAETVLSMARSMLGGAISMATSAAGTEMSLLMGVQKDIWFIKDELKTMQAFLVAAEAMKNKKVLLKVWAEQVRDLAYGIEDCLDEFMVHVGSQSLSRQLFKLKDRHRIANQIRDLKSRVEEVSSRNTRYNLIMTEASGTIEEVNFYVEDVCNHSASNIDEAQLVGFAKPKKELIKMVDVSTEDGLAKVICVVGMGGLGKSTLARKTYESKEDVMKNFSCCAWITVSQSFFKIELLKDMIRQLLGDDSLKSCLEKHKEKAVQVKDLGKHLREELKEKRYFIVLDDLWTTDAWKWIIDIALPSNNIKGSRIIVTTRNVGLAKQITHESHIYHLKPLEIDDAISLLLRKIRKTQEDMKNDVNMRNLVTKIVNKCGCLPLAVLTIGGMLATKILTEWESIYKQIPLELEINPSLEAMRRIVTLSYNHLPSHLKSCFLYLSIFPEDFEIKRRRLVERWIAEGFVRAMGGMNVEDVGKSYFNELINRSMIQPSRVNIEGSVKSCRVHDIMRDVMLSISRDENFVYLARDNATSVAKENFRHVAYHGSNCQKIGMDWGHVRSLTVFGERPTEPLTSIFPANLRMLRTLDLEDVEFRITQKNISNIWLLRHLKYMNVSHAKGYNNIYKLPNSIGKLQGLQTLNIGKTHIATLPTEISKLQSLRSLRCRRIAYFYYDPDDCTDCLINTFCLPLIFTPLVGPDERAERIAELHMACSSRWSISSGVRVPRGISKLKELRILEVVDIKRTSRKAIKELGDLMQLRKLSVTTHGATEQKCKILRAVIQKLPSLCSLHVNAIDPNGVGRLEWVHSISSPPPLLRSLTLWGYLGEMPDWIGNLRHLVKIRLRGSQLKESKSSEIVGEKLVFTAGAFPNLRILHIDGLYEVREVRFDEGTSPHMERIQVGDCRLESGIIGIKHLPRLKEISLGLWGRVAELDVLQGEVDAHPNHPVLRLAYVDRSYHDLGKVVQGSNAVQVEAAEESCPPEPEAHGGESSQMVMSTANVSEGDLLYTYNSC